MLQMRPILAALAGAFLICSCGNGKKLKAANSEIEQLRGTNQELVNKNNDLQKQVAAATASNQTMQQDFANYKTKCQQSEEKLRVMQAVIQEQYNSMNQVEKKIETALADFRDKGVDVYYKDGLVYVRMQDALLYKTGSAALGDKGKTALASLSNVLNEYPKLKVIVVGNTDDVQYKKGGGDNWSLSTERANGVVRVLRDNYKVDPSRLTAAGRSKWDPIADNSTVDGKAQNRRTDIVLNPDLQKLWQSVQP